MSKQLKHPVTAALSAVPYTHELLPTRVKSYSARAIGTNYQAGGSIADIEIKGNHNKNTSAQAGRDIGALAGRDITQNSVKGNSNQQAGHNITRQSGSQTGK